MMNIFTYEDVLNAVEYDLYPDGNYKEWFRALWEITDKRKLNRWDTMWELLGIYRLVYQAIRLYRNFGNILNGFDEEDEVECGVELNMLYGDEFDDYFQTEVDDFVLKLITSYDYNLVADCFKNMGTSRVFESLYACFNEDILDENDSFDEVDDDILNNVDADKMTAYEWLDEIMR